MKIIGINPVQSGVVRPSDINTPGRKKAVERGADSYQPTSEALEKSIARTAYKATPDVREDRVAALRAQIESGNYKVSAWDIASKMVDALV